MRIKPGFAFKAGIYFAGNCFLRTLSGALGKKLYLPPNLIDIKLTLKCNVQCRQCPVWQVDSGQELDTAQWKNILTDIRKTVGPCFVRFYGGEPFCRDDLMELIRYANAIGIIVLITTNGTLITKGIADSLRQRDIGLINISLDGAEARTHDRLRGREVFARAMEAIGYLQGHIPVQINTTIMEENLDEIIALADLAKRRNLQISFQGLINLQKNSKDKKEYVFLHEQNRLFPKDKEKINRVFDRLKADKTHNPAIVNSRQQLEALRRYCLSREKQGSRQCGALRNNHLIIKEKGDAYICSLSASIGDLTKQDLKTVWFSDKAEEASRLMRDCGISQCRTMRGYQRQSAAEMALKVKRCLFDRLKAGLEKNQLKTVSKKLISGPSPRD